MVSVTQRPEVGWQLDEARRLNEESAAARPEWFNEQRRRGLDLFAEMGFPSPRQEDWKYTNPATVVATHFRRESGAADLSSDSIGPLLIGPEGWPRLVFVNGQFLRGLSLAANGPWGEALDLADAVETGESLVRDQLGLGLATEDGFAALNTAFLDHGPVIRVRSGQSCGPIELVYVSLSRQTPVASHPRALLVLEAGATATVVEHYVSVAAGESSTLTNAITQVVLGDGAALDHYRLAEESPGAFHIATTRVEQARGSSYSSHCVTIGGALSRLDLRVRLGGERATCSLNGLYAVDGARHADHHTSIEHAVPRCTSSQLYHGVLDDSARAVFNGRILVRADAQQTDAHQINRNLLLSREAHVDTKPQLEIFADDVRCTHGATVGQLDRDALFYLKSRGLSPLRARSMLTFGFMQGVLQRMSLDPVRKRLERTFGAELL